MSFINKNEVTNLAEIELILRIATTNPKQLYRFFITVGLIIEAMLHLLSSGHCMYGQTEI